MTTCRTSCGMVSVAASPGYPQGEGSGPENGPDGGASGARIGAGKGTEGEIPDAPSSAAAASAIVGKRSSGAFSSARSTTASIAGGTLRRRGGSTSAMARSSVSTPSSVPHGLRPVSSSNATVPHANWSVLPSTRCPRTCSGAMYAGVPANTLALIDARRTASVMSCPAGSASSVRRAMPKSSTFTTPSARTMTFSGFTSRWTMPARWAASSARAMSTSQRRRCSAGTPARPMKARSGVPATSSIARKAMPSCSPTSKIETALG